MIDPEHSLLPFLQRCPLTQISLSACYGPGKIETPQNLALKKLIGGQFVETPLYCSCQMASRLPNQGYYVGRKRCRRLMGGMGLRADDQSVGLTVWNPLAAELLSGALPRMPVGPDSRKARGRTGPLFRDVERH